MEKSQTGNKGYTLVEVLFSIVILSAGLSVIMPAFFKSADMLNHLSARYEAAILTGELEVEAENRLKEFKDFTGFPLDGKREKAGRKFTYKIDMREETGKKDIYQMTSTVEWDDFKHNSLQTTLYLIKG